MSDVDTAPSGLQDLTPKALNLPTPDIEKYQSDNRKIIKNEIGALAASQGKEDKLQGQYNKIAKDQIDAEGLTAKSLGKWNEKEEEAKFHTDPVKAFASLGSVFGILASSFTRDPAVNAMNASAAAITAINESDSKGYENAYRAWKENNDLAIKRSKIEQQAYNDARDLMKTNIQAGRDKLRTSMARFGLEHGLVALDNGMDEELWKHIDMYEKATAGLEQNRENMMTLAARQLVYTQQGGDPKKLPTDPQNVQAFLKMQALLGDGKQAQTPEQKELALFAADGQNHTLKEIEDKQIEIHRRMAKPGTPQSQYVDMKVQEIRNSEGREPSPEEYKKIIEEAPKSQSNIGVIKDEGVLNMMADQAAAGDKSVFASLGYGNARSINSAEIRRRITERHPEITGDKLAQINANFTAYSAGQSSEARAGGTRAAQLKMVSDVLDTAIPQALEASANIPRSAWVSYNKALQTGQREFSDPRLKRLEVANIQLAELWSKAMNPTGQMTDSNRDLALHILRTADGSKAYEAAAAQLKKSIIAEKEGVDRARSEMPGGNVGKKSSGGWSIERVQ